MSAPLWVSELAGDFWSRAGEPGPYPRCLRGPAVRGLVLTIIDLPGLRLSAVMRWLRHHGIDHPRERDRALRACLVARGGGSFVFIDPDDDEAERRFSLAHEIAHFLREYLRPRDEVVRRLGAAALEVLDGLRQPTPEERLHGVVAGLWLGGHTHLLEREPGRMTPEIVRAEEEADRLAFELLAPARVVLAGGPADLGERLCRDFGLPAAQAAVYAELLVPPPPPANPFLARLRSAKFLSNSPAQPGTTGEGGSDHV